MTSKISQLRALIDGQHCMGNDGLRDYHCAKAALNAARKRNTIDRFNAIRLVLKNHNVIVSLTADGKARIHCPIKRQEMEI